MGINYTLLTQAYEVSSFSTYLYYIFLLEVRNTFNSIQSNLNSLSKGKLLLEFILMSVTRNSRFYLSLMKYFLCHPFALFLVSNIDHMGEVRLSCLEF